MDSLDTKVRKHVPNQRKALKEVMKHIGAGELNKAEKMLTDFLENNPDASFAHMLLGNVHYKSKNYIAALEEYQAALEINPDLAQAILMMGRTYSAMEDTESAIEQFDHALQLDPSQENVYLQMGRTQISANNIEGARKAVEKALSVNPNSISARLMSVELLTRNSEFDKAIEELKQLTNQRPNLVIAHKTLGILYAKEEKTENAKECFETVVKLAPDQAVGYIILGNLYFKLKDYSTAEQTFRAALNIKPDLKPAQYRLADTLIALDRDSEALAILRGLADRSPRKNEVHQRFAAIHAKHGRFDLSLKECYSALKFDDSILFADPEIAAMLGENTEDTAKTVQKFLDRLEEIRRQTGKKRHKFSARKGSKKPRAGMNRIAQV